MKCRGIRVALAGNDHITGEVNRMIKSKKSMGKVILPGIVFACGMAGTVQAATMGSGPVYGGSSQDRVLCEIVNVGNTPMTFVKTVIYDEFHGSIALSFNSCI